MIKSTSFTNGLGVFATAISLCLATTSSGATGVVLAATADSIVLDGSSSVNPFPGILASELGTSGAGTIWLSTLKFDLSSIVGMQVNSASLELTTIFNHSGGSFSHQLYSSSNDSWTEATINGINRPANSTLTLLSATSINGISKPYTWNALSGVTGSDGLGGTGTLLTFVVRPDLIQTGSVFGPHFNDRSAGSGFPRLLLDVSPVPESASWLLLTAGLALFFVRSGTGKRIAKRADTVTRPASEA